ncbi:DMP19 family protein [Thalassotalea euphylliae]|uniref:DMP19 family protein n=1 Tax=Thalassotalea euphylliae TaxID=1655234 RepID=UPI00363438E2
MNDLIYAAYDKALENLGLNGFDALSEQDKVIATTFAIEAEVNNGGFDQFFFNSSGDIAFYAPTALVAIGAFEMAKIARKANLIFGSDGPDRDWHKRTQKLFSLNEKFDDYLEDLDDQFYKYPNDIGALLEAYILKHSSGSDEKV